MFHSAKIVPTGSTIIESEYITEEVISFMLMANGQCVPAEIEVTTCNFDFAPTGAELRIAGGLISHFEPSGFGTDHYSTIRDHIQSMLDDAWMELITSISKRGPASSVSLMR